MHGAFLCAANENEDEDGDRSLHGGDIIVPEEIFTQRRNGATFVFSWRRCVKMTF
jgi:hypothetical protein